jgi:hypothetical protein
MGYSWGQFIAYLAEARRRSARAQLEQLVLANRAYHGGDKATEMARELARAAAGDVAD